MAIPKLISIPLFLAAALAGGLYFASHASVKPESEPGASLAPHYMGQAVLAIPSDFKLESGRLSVACEGRPGLTAVMETPHQYYGPVAYEALSIMLPQGPSQIIRDLSLDFGRPAQLVHTALGPGEALESVIADFGSGSLRLSRTLAADSIDNDFAREALDFLENYTWGHRGAKSDDLHSFYGYVGRARPCLTAKLKLLFTSENQSIKLLLTNMDDPAQKAKDAGLELSEPSWLAETKKILRGQLKRKVRGGPREVAGRPGLEWVSLSRDLASGQTVFTAQWLPEEAPGLGPMPAIIMNAPVSEAPAALSLWNDILLSSTLAADF